jgi:hypothetical protein
MSEYVLHEPPVHYVEHTVHGNATLTACDRQYGLPNVSWTNLLPRVTCPACLTALTTVAVTDVT